MVGGTKHELVWRSEGLNTQNNIGGRDRVRRTGRAKNYHRGFLLLVARVDVENGDAFLDALMHLVGHLLRG